MEHFMRHLVIPEGLRALQQVLQVESTQIIPPFDPIDSNCNNVRRGKPNIDIRSDYHKTGLQADYLLYIGVVDRPETNFLAYADFCVAGGDGRACSRKAVV